MKSLYFIILMMFPVLLYSQWQWNNPTATNQDLYSIEYIDDNNLFVTGRFGTRLLSTDNGESWIFSTDTAQVHTNREVQFINENDGWIIGGSFIYQTTNGGVDWDKKIIEYTDLYCLSFIDESVGWISGMFCLYKTIDGGNSWDLHFDFVDLISPPAEVLATDIQFLDEDQGFVTLEDDLGSYFCSTSDGGASWEINLSEYWGQFYKLYFIDNNTGWILGNYFPNGSWILKTEDGGLNWSTTTFITTNTSMNDILFKDLNEGWICGSDGDVFHTVDGGYNWTLQQTNITNNLISISINSSGVIAVAGAEGTILESVDNGQSWNSLNHKFSDNDFYATYFIDDQNGWITGRFQKIYHTNDGGINWDLQHQGIPEHGRFSEIFFSDSNNGWMVGGNNYGDSLRSIIHTDNGGENWSYQSVPANATGLNSVFFKDNYNGWAVGGGGTLLYTNNSGENWMLIGPYTNSDLRDICFVNSDVGWICGDRVLLKTDDGGLNWELKHTDHSGECMFFINEDIGWIVGGITLIKTTNGGITWEEYYTYFNANDIVFLNEEIGYAARTWDGNIMYTLNGGVTWGKCLPHLQNNMWGLSFSENKGWAVGEAGTILVNENPLIVDISENENTINQPQELIIYPNPAMNEINIVNDADDIVNVSVYSMTGNRIIHNNLVNDKLDVSILKSGLYIIEVNSRTGTYRQKVIIQ